MRRNLPMANTPLNKVRVLIVDDSAFMRKVLEAILISDPQLQVIGHAKDGREAIALAESLKPDVISMDINMPHMDGLQATAQIMTTNPRPIVVVSSESKDGAASTLKALELGAIIDAAVETSRPLIEAGGHHLTVQRAGLVQGCLDCRQVRRL